MSALPAPTLAVVVLGGMFVLYGVDKFLASEEQSEMAREAADHYAAGTQFLHQGKPGSAVAEFARAHTIERASREYELALAEAQIADRRAATARETLHQVLEDDSNDGRANLLMARVQVDAGQYKEADSYYHRAIFGEWPANSPEPATVRLELARMLAEHGSGQELLSELLAIEGLDLPDRGTQKEVARLFLKAGSPTRAVEVWTKLIRLDPDDIDAYSGLGDAQTAAGDYHAAESALFNALQRQPNNSQIHLKLQMVVKLALLDPTSRRLNSAERYRRSAQILRLVRAELNACSGNHDSVAAEKPPGSMTNEIAEATLDEAEKLWKNRGEVCRQAPALDDPLPLLMKKVSQ